ncbi:endonuclease III [Candidatus Pacearchaeota archaeon]|nr:endonuclease III [Candidatus Pacearchaeota archaeon]MBD3283157.1 endonuclease III [Candidatus Pacearchaeota archaeon]
MEKISKTLDILAEYFNYTERTTLNRMRNPEKISSEKNKDFLEKPNAFKILIACLLSLRTRDDTTESVSEKLFKIADTPEAISKIPLKKLEKIIYSSGHYKKKAKTLKYVSRELINKFNGKVPNVKEDLLSIKGIGPKTANIVLNFAYQQPTLPIDTHCHRIPNRLGWIKTKTPEQTEIALEKILPKKYWKEFNAIFVLFGKTICQPVSPLCNQCPVNKYCEKIGVTSNR